jgi:hypothetical protein
MLTAALHVHFPAKRLRLPESDVKWAARKANTIVPVIRGVTLTVTGVGLLSEIAIGSHGRPHPDLCAFRGIVCVNTVFGRLPGFVAFADVIPARRHPDPAIADVLPIASTAPLYGRSIWSLPAPPRSRWVRPRPSGILSPRHLLPLDRIGSAALALITPFPG